jgi:hypothetical protein
MPTDRKQAVPNGINGVTGNYDVAPIAIEDLARALKGIPPEETAPDHVVGRGKKLRQPSFTRALPWGVEPHDVARAGWAVVFHKDEQPEVRQALRPLIEHRRAQVGDEARLKELTYHPEEDASGWLARHEVSWHNVEPTKVPYYLLWVGSPELMPFEVTHEIDSDYCVGLLDFDSPEEYARYADSVIAYEKAPAIRNTREAVFFGTRHKFDEATLLSADWLVTPLADGTPASGSTPAEKAVAEQLGFRQRKFVGDAATRETLLKLLGGTDATPSLLFTASHGMVWPNGHPLQFQTQGALLCQDWPGFGSVDPKQFVCAADVPDTARLHGLVTFHFACFGGGTPREDLYVFERNQQPPPIAPRPFTAALPRRLLAHPGGGALACIAHIERAWGSSITGITASPQIRAFQRAIAQILVGKPVGVAVQEFNDMSATLSDVLAGLLGKAFQNIPIDDVTLASTWMQRNDAGGFVLLGDPAVKLRVADLV